MAVHIALHEIGAPFESRFISLTGTANRAPDYLALNPEGKVPTLRSCSGLVRWKPRSVTSFRRRTCACGSAAKQLRHLKHELRPFPSYAKAGIHDFS